MVKVITTGREDLEKLWEKSNILSHFKREYHPFLVFIEKDNEIQVEIYKEVDKLVRSNLSNDVRIMVQWQGEWRSDFFHFKFIELVNAYYKKYPLDNVNNMENYYKLYNVETGKQALRGGLETQIFQRWYHHKKEMKAINKRLNKRK